MRMHDMQAAHRHCSRNKNALEKSLQCGCFCCLEVFCPEKIRQWMDEEATALCPFCGIDAVIGDASGYPLTKEFLKDMRTYWF